MPIPYVKKAYDDRASAGRLSDLIRMRGSAEADQIRQQGQQSAQMWSSLGQMAGGTLSGLAQLKYEEPRRQYEAARYQREMDDFNEEDEVDRILDEGGTPDEITTKLMSAGRIGRQYAQEIQEGIAKKTRADLELDKLNSEKTARNVNQVLGYFAEMETAPEEQRAALWENYRPKIQMLVNEDPGEYSSDTFTSKHQGLLQRIDPIKSRAEALALLDTRATKQREIDKSVLEAAPKYLTGVDTPEEWQKFVGFAKSLKASSEALSMIGDYTPENVERWNRVAAGQPKKYPVTTTGPGGGPVDRLATEEEMIAGVPGYRASREPDKPQYLQVTSPDGTMNVMTPQEIRARGGVPTARAGGRQVTTGAATQVADITTSLDDLKALDTALEGNDATGFVAKVGAGLWNPISEATGIGIEAKQKQAMIDRVKQVIGKTLEGGVLRKEDEIKYERILPKISDPKELVDSKLKGLSDAIQLRRERLIESLSDAGYDTAKFTQRQNVAAPPPPPGAGSTVRMRAPNGQEADVPADQVERLRADGAVVVK